MSQLFASGGQSIGVSASTSVLPIHRQTMLKEGSAEFPKWNLQNAHTQVKKKKKKHKGYGQLTVKL